VRDMGHQFRHSSDRYEDSWTTPDLPPYRTSYTHMNHGGSQFVPVLQASKLRNIMQKLEENRQILKQRVEEKKQLQQASNVVDSSIAVLEQEMAALERAVSTCSLNSHR